MVSGASAARFLAVLDEAREVRAVPDRVVVGDFWAAGVDVDAGR
ncbi:MAG TPA: hypothetical protein VNT53_01550 [Pseudolysinimonas sp.]|nr:hypothetical protein [Pseudolysinimonas sp.]